MPPISSPSRRVRPLVKRMYSLPGSALISATSKPFSIRRPLVGQLEQVGAILHRDRFLLRPVRRLHVNAELGLDALLVVDLLDADEGVVGPALGRGAGDDDLLDQTQLKCPHRVEAVNEVVRVAVRGGVPKRAKRIQRPDGFLRLFGGIDALRLVNDDDGTRGLHEFDRAAARKACRSPCR